MCYKISDFILHEQKCVRDNPGAVMVAGLLVQAEDIDLNRYLLVRDVYLTGLSNRNQTRGGINRRDRFFYSHVLFLTLISFPMLSYSYSLGTGL